MAELFATSKPNIKSIAHKVYDEFNAKRKQLEAKQADADDLKMLEDIENQIKGKS